VALVIVLVALFVPVVHRTPAWPTNLPPLSYDADATIHEQRADLRRAPPPAAREVMSAWRALSQASARRDEAAFIERQQTFAEVLATATEHVRAPALALRAQAAREFLAELRRPDRPLTIIARRHRLAGDDLPVYVDDAARLAWFTLRWERLALPTPEQGPLEGITDSLLRLPKETQRAFVAWGLAARCSELLGTTDRAARPDDPRRCASFRRDLIAATRGFNPNYPRDEAFAAVDMMLGVGLSRVAHATAERPEDTIDESVREAARTDAQAAFVRAREGYVALVERAPSRRYERLLMGAMAELSR